MASAYRAVLGEAFDDLHPSLRAYFDAVPPGAVGRGRGVFDTVGTPRPLLRLLLAPFARAGILFPVWERDVPFTVENRPATGPGGAPAVRAVRRFALRGGTREMRDEIGVRDGVLIDRLGRPVRVVAWFAASVVDGGLRLRSTRVAVRAFGLAVTLPRAIAPVVELAERFDDASERQHVTLTVTVPLLGRVYEYAGRFRYAIEGEGCW